jgi:hypothetical protein
MVIATVAIVILYATTAISGNSLALLVKTEHKQNIVNDVITVNPESYETVRFGVPADATNARITGNFVVKGDENVVVNDIIAVILSEDEFLNWANTHDSNKYYYSGKVTNDSIEINVPAGKTMYLVFDNTFSLYSAKQVTTKLDLLYQQ